MHHQIVSRGFSFGAKMLRRECVIADDFLGDAVTETEAMFRHEPVRRYQMIFAGFACGAERRIPLGERNQKASEIDRRHIDQDGTVQHFVADRIGCFIHINGPGDVQILWQRQFRSDGRTRAALKRHTVRVKLQGFTCFDGRQDV